MSDQEQKTNVNPEESPTSNSDDIGAQLKECQAMSEKWKNDYLYLRAEFDNYKRHAIKERSDLLKYGSERLLIDLLEVQDNFDRAIDTKISPENINTYVKGVEITAQELKTVLQKFGVTEEKSLGQPFNPMVHEALSSEVSAEVPEGHVLRVFKKGFKFHDKLIRPAQVIVAKKPSE